MYKAQWKTEQRVKPSLQGGFTLLEVIITLGILTTMIIAVSTLLRSSFDVRFALSQEAKVTHRLNVAMQKISSDLSHAFILSSKDLKRNGPDRTSKTIFKIERGGDGEKLSFTTMNHKSIMANTKESDSGYVVYMLKDAKEAPGRKHLYRGEFVRIPGDFKEDPPFKLIAQNIKTISFEPWRGDKWSKSKWDSSRSDTSNKLPHMVRITVEAWLEDPDDQTARSDELVEVYRSIAYLPYASRFKELKDKVGSVKL